MTYGSPLGRPSGVVHLTVHHWKTTVSCLAAAGFSVLAASAVPVEAKSVFVPLSAIETYCSNPASPPSLLPAKAWKKFDKACHCFSSGTVCK